MKDNFFKSDEPQERTIHGLYLPVYLTNKERSWFLQLRTISNIRNRKNKRDQYVTYRPLQTLTKPYRTNTGELRTACKYSILLMKKK